MQRETAMTREELIELELDESDAVPGAGRGDVLCLLAAAPALALACLATLDYLGPLGFTFEDNRLRNTVREALEAAGVEVPYGSS